MTTRALLVAACAIACHQPPTTPSLQCGEGTTQQGSACVPSGVYCGTGTQDSNGTCIPSTSRFLIRAPKTIVADGWSTTEVRVVGSNPDGSPDLEPVVLTMDRSGAGAFASPAFALDELGGASNFLPCNSATDAGCVGPVQLQLARAAAPQTPVATVDVMLVAPAQIGDAAPCGGAGNLLYLDGNNFYVNGPTTWGPPNWTVTVVGGAQGADAQIVMPGPATTNWDLTISTAQLGIDLIPSTYPNAQYGPTAKPGEPEMTFTATQPPLAVNCNVTSAFQIIDYGYDPTRVGYVSHFTATFTQQCASDPTRSMTGCVHFSQ
jgi:hypothetical protein